MTDTHNENPRLAVLLRLLMETEMGEDSMICHDGGFHYAGDFMSMEADPIRQASVVSQDDLADLHRRKYVEISEDGSSVRVTEAGRRVATMEIASSHPERRG